MHKFIETLEEEETHDPNSRFPFKDMFKKIRDDLKDIYTATTQKHLLDEKTSNSMIESLNGLEELLDECLRLSKRHRGSKKICLNYYSPAELVFLFKSREKLQVIMQNINKEGTKLNVDSGSISGETDNQTRQSVNKVVRWTSSYFDESKIVGCEKQAEKIIQFLTTGNNDGLKTVGIVGMFGTGKTTLARKIFASEKVMDYFAIRLWVWVSAYCSKEELVRRMLDNLGVEDDSIEKALEMDSKLEPVGVLLFLLHLELMNKRYLIVFDDVVNVESWHCELEKTPPEDKQWTDRLAYGLPKGEESAIIVTSKKEDDTRKMLGSKGYIHTPEPLLGEDGWTLFKRAYEEASKQPLSDATLEKLKDEITRKCDGLPLALKAAGERMGRAAKQKEEEAKQKEEDAKQKKEEAIHAETSGLETQQA